MKALLSALLVLAPVAALAEPPPRPSAAEVEKHQRTARTIGLAEALDLDAAQALQLAKALAPYDERRKAIHEQLRQADEALRAAAESSAATAAQVDQALQQRADAFAQLQQLDREQLNALSKGMTPQQRARLAGFLMRPPPPPGHGPGEGHFGPPPER